MEIILLGEKFSTKYATRNISSVAIRFDNYNESCLFDCGEGTQHYILFSSLKSRQIKRIMISELNSDSCLGIVGLLATFSLNERITALDIYAPPGFCKYLRLFSRYSQTNFSYPVNFFSIQEGIICSFSEYQVLASSLRSYPEIYGYSIIEKERMGKFKIDYAQNFKIPPGPLYKNLKIRDKFILNNGLVISGKHFCEQPKRGRKLTYITHLNYNPKIIEASWKTDVLLINKNINIEYSNSSIHISSLNNLNLIKKIFRKAQIQNCTFTRPITFKNRKKIFIFCLSKISNKKVKSFQFDLTPTTVYRIKAQYIFDKIKF